jgi:predicted metalloprotease with PDZ domain
VIGAGFHRICRCCVAATIAIFAQAACAEVLYRVEPEMVRGKLKVEMTFPVSSATVELQMPSWLPGIYTVRSSWTTSQSPSAVDEQGATLPVSSVRGDTWAIQTGGHHRITIYVIHDNA